MSASDLAISSSHSGGGCFFRSTSTVYSLKEVITILVLGILTILMAMGILYGYIIDPSWMIGAHVLVGATCLTIAVGGLLMFAKAYPSLPEKPDDQIDDDGQNQA